MIHSVNYGRPAQETSKKTLFFFFWWVWEAESAGMIKYSIMFQTQKEHRFFLTSQIRKNEHLKYSLQQPDCQNNWTGWDHTGLFDGNQELLKHWSLHWERLEGNRRTSEALTAHNSTWSSL